MSEVEIIEGCLKGEMGARSELYRLYMPKMLGVCKRLVVDGQIAEDIVHDGFLRVFEKISDYNNTGSFEGWLRRIFINMSLSYLRSNKTVFTDEISDQTLNGNCIEPEGLRTLEYEELIKMIGKLPDCCRVVLNLYCVEGYKHEEISQLLGISQRTSISRLSKAKKLLMDQLIGSESNIIGSCDIVEIEDNKCATI